MSRKLEDLIPVLAIKATQLKLGTKEMLHCDLLYTCTWRSFGEQAELYAQGRTSPGRIVTWAKAGESYHNYGLAFDFVPMVGGKPDWDDGYLFGAVGELGEDLGLQWGGRWPGKKRDLPHFQLSFGFSVNELLNLYNDGGIKRVWDECNHKFESGLWP